MPWSVKDCLSEVPADWRGSDQKRELGFQLSPATCVCGVSPAVPLSPPAHSQAPQDSLQWDAGVGTANTGVPLWLQEEALASMGG